MAIKKILMTRSGKKFYVSSTDADFHSQFGFVSKDQLEKEDGSTVSTNTGKEFNMFSPGFLDHYKKIKRDAQIIPLKDIGIIISETGINHESKILDSGSGSGALCCFLAKIAKKVVSYELREDFFEVASSNKEMLGLSNLTIKNRNVYTELEDEDTGFDVFTLDVPEPWEAVSSAQKALRPGGFLVSYSPSVPQVADFVNAIKQNENFVFIKTMEIIEREWEVHERKVRPKTAAIGHSGFLSFARKVTK
jgi:tRNA (adenine57-N1/adenine58-N1)-methyltransferase catalytic subunit